MVSKRTHPTHWTGHVRKAITALTTVRGWPRRVLVSGPSMLPAFCPGDRLLVVPVKRLVPGDVIALRDPGRAGRLLVKRVHLVTADTVDVRGDNEAASTDSRSFGPVPHSSVIGRVLYRYGPPGRTGWLPQ